MDIEFAFPTNQWPLWLAAGALALALLALLFAWFERRRAARLHAFVEAGLAPRLLAGYDVRVRRPLLWLPLLGFALLLVALAQPRWGRAWEEVSRTSRDFLILLDTSESMNANDLPPSRLQRARAKIEALEKRFPGDRFGLIAFSGAAALQSPLTQDHNYFRTVLQAVDTNTLDAEGTDIAAAFEEAKRVFDEEIAQGNTGDRESRAIVLVSDGEQVSGDAVAAAKKIGAYSMIYVLGIGGAEGATVKYPDWMKRYAPPPDGKDTHTSKLDWDTLSKIAVDGGGLAVRITPDNSDVDAIQKELDLLHADATSSNRRFNLMHRYRWPLAGAVACFAAEAIWIALMPVLRQRRQRRLQASGEEASYA